MNAYLSRKISLLSLLAAVMVVYVHAYNLYDAKTQVVSYRNESVFFLEQLVSQGLCRVAVPLFFVLSGYLFFQNFSGGISAFYSKIRKRTRTILIPYLLWSLLGFIAMWILNTYWLKSTDSPGELSFRDIADKILIHPVAYQLWFLRDLMILVLLSPLLYLLIYFTRWFPFLICTGLWMSRVEPLIIASQALCFFVLGASIALRSETLLLNVLTRRAWLLLIPLWVAVLLFKLVYFQESSEGSPFADVIHKTAILIGLPALWIAYDLVTLKRNYINTFLLWIGPGFAFFLFVFHEPTLSLIKKTAQAAMPDNAVTRLAQYVLAPVIVMLLAMVLSKAMQRYLPLVYRILTGSR
ncbi:MAG: acyltransferase [Bacteroidetes bacterium]|nr:acyltransferase [Bacteroidota bacterium]